MKLVMYGNFTVDYCSEVHYARSLASLHHKVIKLQETEVTTEEVERQALISDGLIWIHSHGFKNKGKPMAEVLANLKAKKIPTIAYHLDLYMGLERWREYADHDYFKVEHFFTVDKLMADWFNANTQTKGHYILPGVFHGESYLDEQVPYSQMYPVIFTGSYGYHPEYPYRPKLIDWLKSTYKDRFGHFGNDGERVVRGKALNNLYANTKIVIGDTLCKDFTYPYFYSDRLMEVPGRGGFQIFPYIKGITDLFQDRETIVLYDYNNFEQLKYLIDYYLENDEERETIRLAAHNYVKESHTYLQRWREILREVYDKN